MNVNKSVFEPLTMALNGSYMHTSKSVTDFFWFQDLTKWKIRRRSTKSDLRTKSQDREHVINQMTNGAVTDFKNETHNRLPKRCGGKSSARTLKNHAEYLFKMCMKSC